MNGLAPAGPPSSPAVRIVREAAYWVFMLSGLTRLAARLNRRKILVLGYHGFYDGPGDALLNFDGMHVRTRRFARQMRYLAKRYRVVGLGELRDGSPPPASGRPLAVITIDDGYRSVRRCAHPILKRLGLPATVFIPIDFILGGRGLWWDRLRAMLATRRRTELRLSIDGAERVIPLVTPKDRVAAAGQLAGELRRLPPGRREELMQALAASLGVEPGETGRFGEPLTVPELRDLVEEGIAVGSHACSHDSLLHLSAHTLAGELSESKQWLERVARQDVEWLAYPHGDFSPAVVDAAMRAGYRGGLSTIEGLNDGRGGAYAVKRIGVDDTMTIANFMFATSGLRDFLKDALAAAKRGRSPIARRPTWAGSERAEKGRA